MADVFEKRADLVEHRSRLWAVVESTRWLDWLLLTKRPQNIGAMVPWQGAWPANVWIGATVENQLYAQRRLPHLLAHPARVRFLSCEPLLGKVELAEWLGPEKINWVIAGGESGHASRPMSPAWVRALRDQCGAAGVGFHFKQWGHWVPAPLVAEQVAAAKLQRVDGTEMVALGKKASGRELDGVFWNQLPALS